MSKLTYKYQQSNTKIYNYSQNVRQPLTDNPEYPLVFVVINLIKLLLNRAGTAATVCGMKAP